jgi:hypothetical protein
VDFSMAAASFRAGRQLWLPAYLLRKRAFIGADNCWALGCCGGYFTGTMEKAPEEQADAQSPQPMHVDVSKMLIFRIGLPR